MTHTRSWLGLAVMLLASGRPVFAQTPPPLDDFVALASKDEKVSAAAAARLTPVWKDSYAAMVIDLARFFRPARPNSPAGAADDSLGEDDPLTGAAPRGGRETPFVAGARTPESLIRGRLIRFLAQRTKKSFGGDLKKWRKWSWTLPYEPHPEFSMFKARLYANVDPRMASFFESTVPPRIRLDEIDWGGRLGKRHSPSQSAEDAARRGREVHG